MLKAFFQKYGAVLLIQLATIAFIIFWLKPAGKPDQPSNIQEEKKEMRLQEQILYDSLSVLHLQQLKQQKLIDGLQGLLRESKTQITYFQNKLYAAQQQKSPVIPQLPQYNSDSILRYWAKEFDQ